MRAHSLFVLLALVSAVLLGGCARHSINGPNLQAFVEAEIDFAAGAVPHLEARVDALRGTPECVDVASLLLYARWVPYNAQALLASASPALAEDPGSIPDFPGDPKELCEPEVTPVTRPAPSLPPVSE